MHRSSVHRVVKLLCRECLVSIYGIVHLGSAGERITFAGANNDGQPDAAIAPKKLHKLLKDLQTNEAGVAQFKQIDFMTSAGPVTSSMKNVPVR
jgi:hypothetical protein